MMRLAVAVLCTVFAAATAAAQVCRVAPQSVWLPTDEFFHLDGVSIGGGPPQTLQIDTGSTGIAIGYMHIGKSTPLKPDEIARFHLDPYINYNSSGKTPVGRWVWTSVRLTHQNVLIPRVPVLAATHTCQVPPGQTPTADCIHGPPVPSEVETLGMMGIGFDRGPSMGTWQVNPFLNAQAMVDGTMQRGYIVTNHGVRLGMSPQDIVRFTFFPLTPIAKPYEWKQARGCVSMAERGGVIPPGAVCGEVLMDTGVDIMYVSYDKRSMPAFRPPVTARNGDFWSCVNGACTTLRNVDVRVTWPNATAPGFEYPAAPPKTFSPTSRMPAQLHVRGTTLTDPGENVFVNTSRQLLNFAEYLYDASCGRIGFHRLPPK
jgi:hypothetical protein